MLLVLLVCAFQIPAFEILAECAVVFSDVLCQAENKRVGVKVVSYIVSPLKDYLFLFIFVCLSLGHSPHCVYPKWSLLLSQR